MYRLATIVNRYKFIDVCGSHVYIFVKSNCSELYLESSQTSNKQLRRRCSTEFLHGS